MDDAAAVVDLRQDLTSSEPRAGKTIPPKAGERPVHRQEHLEGGW